MPINFSCCLGRAIQFVGRNAICEKIICVRNLLRGEGWGVQPKFYMELNFEIAVDQKEGTQDQTFEGVPNFQCRILRAGWPRPILTKNLAANFGHLRAHFSEFGRKFFSEA